MKKENRESKNKSNCKMIWENTCKRADSELPEHVARFWVRYFSLAGIFDEEAVICYSGRANLEDFQDKYRKIIEECLLEEIGYPVTVKFQQGKKRLASEKADVPRMEENRNFRGERSAAVKWCMVYAVLILSFVLGMAVWGNHSVEKNFYQMSASEIEKGLRILQISDLYGAEYGKDNSSLIEQAELLNPDVVILSGNIAGNKESIGKTAELCRRLMKIAPVYYGYGEKEMILTTEEGELEALLESEGVHVLKNESEILETETEKISIYGMLPGTDNAEESYIEFLESDPEIFKLSIVNNPGIIKESEEQNWGDLILSGYYLGGKIRIPYLGALYDRDGGLFAERREKAYISGTYGIGDGVLVVSRGMSKKGIRLNNRPELLIIDVTHY